LISGKSTTGALASAPPFSLYLGSSTSLAELSYRSLSCHVLSTNLGADVPLTALITPARFARLAELVLFLKNGVFL